MVGAGGGGGVFGGEQVDTQAAGSMPERPLAAAPADGNR